MDLRQVLRESPGDVDALKGRIRDAMSIKPHGHDFAVHEKPIIMRHMSVTGG